LRMTVTAEQLFAMMSDSMSKMQLAVAALADSQAKAINRDGGGPKRVLEMRHRSIPQFEGGTGGQFDDWAFAFKRMIRAVSRNAYEMMVMAETGATMEEITKDVEFDEETVNKYSAEIYDLLCQAVKGDPLQAVKSIDDMEGLKAWHKLTAKYSPKSMARAVRLVGQVTNPAKITDLSRAEAELDKWEELVKTLQKDFNEKFSDTVKVGIVATMMPVSVQELIYQSIGKTANYDEVIQKVRAVVSNKVAMMMNGGPTPMDIGEIRCGTCHQGWEEAGDNQGEDVGAVNYNTQCYTCGGWGHLGRDCPTAKGKGKGKGIGKGGKDAGKGWKGLGKGGKDAGGKGATAFRGECWKCGKTGHRAVECRARQANMVEEDGANKEDQDQEVGGLWTIGAIEVQAVDHEVPVSTHSGPAFHQVPVSTRSGSTFHEVPVSTRSGSTFHEVPVSTRSGSTFRRGSLVHKNPYGVLADDDDEVEVMAVDPAKPMTRMSAIEFHVADVKKPLASAARMVKAGNRIVLDDQGSYILNKATGETMEVMTRKDTFVFDVQFESGEVDTITLDSGAGVHVWPRSRLPEVPLLPKADGLRMIAANGSEIKNYGRKLIKFRGNDFRKKAAEDLVFAGRV